MSEIKVSIILPILNAEEDIEDLFVSLKNQVNINKKEFEIILVNDGSDDNTIEKSEMYKPFLSDFGGYKIVNHNSREGLTKTRLDGANVAKGEYIAFVDKKTRPDSDYFENFLNKRANTIIGNVYMDKYRSSWDRVLYLVRKKLYKPYFGYIYKDIRLTADQYKKFKNKGGGGAMFVKKDYFLQANKNFKATKHTNDDSKLILRLASIDPILKTYSSKTLYLNRIGYRENIKHLFYRGPKFVDYYLKPGTRFFFSIILLLISIPIIFSSMVFIPSLIIPYLFILILIIFSLSIYLSEEISDVPFVIIIVPVAFIAFAMGIIYGSYIKFTT